MNAVYLPFLVRDLRDFVDAIEPLRNQRLQRHDSAQGAILRYLDDCDPLAQTIGAVNTVVVRGGGKLYGYNTDYVGVLRTLERRMPLAEQPRADCGRGRRGASGGVCACAGGRAVCDLRAAARDKLNRLARAVGGEAIARKRSAARILRCDRECHAGWDASRTSIIRRSKREN